MNFTIKGLKTIDPAKVSERLEDFELGDVLAYGMVGDLQMLCDDPDKALEEAVVLSNLIAGMLATGCTQGLAFYNKFWLGHTEEDLRPELENMEFETDDAIYVVIDIRDPETYHSWVKKLGQWHLNVPGRSDTLCGRPMLGNNYAIHIESVNREKCNECFSLVNEGVDKICG
jgi:hypothetical protein